MQKRRKLPAVLLFAVWVTLTLVGIRDVQHYDVSPRFLATALLDRMDIESLAMNALLI